MLTDQESKHRTRKSNKVRLGVSCLALTFRDCYLCLAPCDRVCSTVCSDDQALAHP